MWNLAGIQFSRGRGGGEGGEPETPPGEPGEMAAPGAPADVGTGVRQSALRPSATASITEPPHHHSLTFSKVEKWVFDQFSELLCLDQWSSMRFPWRRGEGMHFIQFSRVGDVGMRNSKEPSV